MKVDSLLCNYPDPTKLTSTFIVQTCFFVPLLLFPFASLHIWHSCPAPSGSWKSLSSLALRTAYFPCPSPHTDHLLPVISTGSSWQLILGHFTDHILLLLLLSLSDLTHLMTLNSISVQMPPDMCPAAWAAGGVSNRHPNWCVHREFLTPLYLRMAPYPGPVKEIRLLLLQVCGNKRATLVLCFHSPHSL